jgi:hypothetical protein
MFYTKKCLLFFVIIRMGHSMSSKYLFCVTEQSRTDLRLKPITAHALGG